MINPILERELKTRMRTWKTPIVLMIYLIFIGIIVALFFVSFRQNSMYMYGGYGSSGGFDPSIAIKVYNVIMISQFVMLMLILPTFTATSVSGERERQTLDLLLCTDFSPWKIILGKMSSALSFVFLMIITTVPFMAIVFLFGGVSLWDIAKVILFYMLTSILVSSIGIYCSTRFKKVISSIIVSYLIMGILFVGTLITFGVVMMILNMYGNYEFVEKHMYDLMLAILGPNPGFGLFSFYYGDYFSLSRFVSVPTNVFTSVKPWMVSVAFDVVISTLLIILTRFRLTRIR